MTLQIGLMLLIILASVVLFSLEQLRPDVIALAILLSLTLTGLLPAAQAFDGFGSDTVVMIFGLLALTAAMLRTGVIDYAGRKLLRAVGDRPGRLLPTPVGVIGALSGFISNTATTALFLPIVLDVSRRTCTPRAKLLMPVAFAAILASSVSLVASSTNLLVSGLMADYGLPPLSMFELAPVGLPILLAGLVYLLTVAPALTPVRDTEVEDEPFGIHPYVAEAIVLPESRLIGRTLREAALGRDLDLTVIRIVRGGNRYIVPRPDLKLEASDELLLRGLRGDILRIKDTAGLAFKA